MRAIAKEAGVATGNAYYYFGSEEELIQVCYAGNHAEHAAACQPVLAAESRLGARMRGVLRALIDVQAPYHSLTRPSADGAGRDPPPAELFPANG